MRKRDIIATCIAFTVALTNVAAQKFQDTGDYEYIGCYNDMLERAIYNIHAVVYSVDECRKVAEDNGYDIFALQASGYCFVGHNNATYDKYGLAPVSECWGSLGGSWTNQVYRKKSAAPPTPVTTPSSWDYKGCFKDNENRTISNYLGQVQSVEQCQQMAIAQGFNTFGLQGFGACFGGIFSQYDKLGKETNCGTLGIAWSNQVYVKPYTYKGCYNDGSTRPIPNYLGKGKTVAACKLLAFTKRYDTFALQNHGECWAGSNPSYAYYGSPQKAFICPTTGDYQLNQVYSMN